MLNHHSVFVIHTFMTTPAPSLTHKANSEFAHSVDTSKKRVFDFLLNPTSQKRKKQSYSSLENSLWSSSTLETTKALFFAK